MNYQRACRGGCYQGAPAVHHPQSRYSKDGCSYRALGETGVPYGAKDDTDLHLPAATSLAMVYSPVQHWRDIYDTDRALERGTLFAELDKPLCSAGR